MGEKRKALDYFEQALPLKRAVGNQGGEATALGNIGLAWADLDEKRKALDYYEQVLPLYQAVGDWGGEATALNNMSVIYTQNGDFSKALAIFQQIIPIVHAMGAAAQEAAFILNIAVVYEKMGKIDEAIQSAEAGKAILMHNNLPQDAGGNRIAKYDAFLARLRNGRGDSAPPDDADQAMQMLMQLYQQGGADAVRSAFTGRMPDAMIDGLLQHLSAHAGSDAPPPSVSTQDAINQLAGATIAVKTSLPDKLAEWRVELERIRTAFASQGTDYANETAFADTLLDVLCDQTAALPADNPYADVVRQVMAAIAAYHAGSG